MESSRVQQKPTTAAAAEARTHCLNMNAALKSQFLSLIDSNIVDTYKNAAGILNPNCAYIQLLDWFTTPYTTSNKANHSQNKAQMETTWNPGTDLKH